MPIAYELAVLGEPTPGQVAEVEAEIRDILQDFDLELGDDVGWTVRPPTFSPSDCRASAAVYFGAPGAALGAAAGLSAKGIPIVPVVSAVSRVTAELPIELRPLNALAYTEGARRVATALLECAGLLPRQRRVFLSYRRDEARSVALQLFDALSARRYDVFLDTHAVGPGEEFQAVLWHRLCESDVLIMLDTPTYFESRWSAAEFGRALSKGITVLRVGWPGVAASSRAATAARVDLDATEVTGTPATLVGATLDRIAARVEAVRSESIAVRRLNLVSKFQDGVRTVGGEILGLGMGAGVYLRLPNDKIVVAYPAVGVPNAKTLHDARLSTPDEDVAVVYDPVGVNRDWLEHLEWLGSHIRIPRWVKVTDAAWDFADWEA